MGPEWVFRKLQPGEKDRQSTVGQFFDTEASGSFVRTLVRESIQNSLDAEPYGDTVRVRMQLARKADAASAQVAERYFEGAWPHFDVSESGLTNRPSRNGNCDFLVIEDFGTTGLAGDVEHFQGTPSEENPFYSFFRTEGRSGKSKGKRGRRGIGKDVFRRSSRVHAFLALTVRSDDERRMLMGQAILYSHDLDGSYYIPDAYFGQPSVKTDGLIVPSEDSDYLESFTADFKLTRKPDEPGLSVVVPWVHDSITTEGLLRETIREYFYPIMAGKLEVTICNEESEHVVDRESIRQILDALNDADLADEMRPVLDLVEWALHTESRVTLNKLDKTPKWDPALIPEDALDGVIRKFRDGERLAFRIPLTIRTKVPRKARPSRFDVYMVRDGAERGTPTFIREDIIIPNVRTRHVAGVRAIVVAKHWRLAELLGDSEDPGHTEWQRNRDELTAKYVSGPAVIDFVKQSVSILVRYLGEDDDKPDKELLRDLFSLPVPMDADVRRDKVKSRKKPKGEVEKPEVEVEPRKARYNLSRTSDGFRVSPGHADASTPGKLSIRTAYDSRGTKNPLKKGAKGGYSPLDFQFGKAPIQMDYAGLTIEECQENRIVATMDDQDFKLVIGGFDENRDLIVRVDVLEVADDQEI